MNGSQTQYSKWNMLDINNYLHEVIEQEKLMIQIKALVTSLGSGMRKLSGIVEIFWIIVGVCMNFSVCICQNTPNSSS